MSEILDEGFTERKVPKIPRIKDGSIIASSADRIKGHLLDLVVLFPVFLTYVFLIEYWFGRIQEGAFFRQLLFLLVYVVFFFLFESIFSRTPGKFYLKTHVVREDGSKPSMWQIAFRNICRLVPLHSLLVLTDDICWHDKVSKTFVVYSKSDKFKI